MLWRILVFDRANDLCRLRGHEADVFPVHSSIDILWSLSLTEFDLWSILGNSLTSFEVQSFLLPLNGRLLEKLVSQVWSNCSILCLDPEQLSINSCFVRELIVTLGLACLSPSFVSHNSLWLGNQMVPNKVTKVGGIQNLRNVAGG